MNTEAIQALAFIENHPGLFLALVIWTMIWKGLALWKAARHESKVWFVVILLVNTMGILEIIYYYFVGKKNKTEQAAKTDRVEYIQDDSRL